MTAIDPEQQVNAAEQLGDNEIALFHMLNPKSLSVVRDSMKALPIGQTVLRFPHVSIEQAEPVVKMVVAAAEKLTDSSQKDYSFEPYYFLAKTEEAEEPVLAFSNKDRTLKLTEAVVAIYAIHGTASELLRRAKSTRTIMPNIQSPNEGYLSGAVALDKLDIPTV